MIDVNDDDKKIFKKFNIVSFSVINSAELIFLIYSWIKLRQIN